MSLSSFFSLRRKHRVVIKSVVVVHGNGLVVKSEKSVLYVKPKKTSPMNSFRAWLESPINVTEEPQIRIYGRIGLVVHENNKTMMSLDDILAKKGFVRQNRIFSGQVTGTQGQRYDVQVIRIGPKNWMLRIKNPPLQVYTGRKGGCFEPWQPDQYLMVNFVVGKDQPYTMIETLEDYIREVGAP